MLNPSLTFKASDLEISYPSAFFHNGLQVSGNGVCNLETFTNNSQI